MNLTDSQSAANGTELTTHRFAAGAALGSGLDLAQLLPDGWVGSVYASGEPEVRELTFGILPLTDCAPLVVAHERGLFKKHGITSSIAKFASWTATRDALVHGSTQAAQMLFGMPIGAAVGKLGSEQKPLVIPWILNRNGQAITLSARHRGLVGASARDLRPLAQESRDKGRPLVFGLTLAPGTHAMWLRYWLAAGGIHPDKDVALITIPPPQMVANMKAERMDGFCVGEPWNARAIMEGMGYTAIFTEEIWSDHPEKVVAFTEEFAEANPNSVKAALKAMHEASVWCDDRDNRGELTRMLARPEYLDCPEKVIGARLGDISSYGDSRRDAELRGVTFHARNANYPQAKYAVWWLSQFRRWSMLPTAPDYLGVAGRVMRPDFYEAALKELGVTHGGADLGPETLFDGKTFDPSEPEDYAASFDLTAIR